MHFPFIVKLVYYLVLLSVPPLIYWFVLPVEFLSIPYWLFFAPIAIINMIIVTEMISSSCCQKRNKLVFKETNDSFLHIGAIIPAYFPNEHEILKKILDHYNHITFFADANLTNYDVTVILVHNGGDKSEYMSQTIQELQSISERFIIIENLNSTSKAENINYALDYIKDYGLAIDVVSIFDADHMPAADTFENVANIFSNNPNLDIMQGRCAVTFEGFFSRMIAIEFSEMYSIYHNGGSILRKFGLFGGSNGHWKFSVIDKIRFDHMMLTEDIDATMRALNDGHVVKYYDKIVSYELSPPSLYAFYTQRLRWSQGWAEVTCKHMYKLLRNTDNLDWWQRMWCFFLLPFREIYYYCVLHVGPAGIIYVVKYGFNHLTVYIMTGIMSFMIFIMMLKSLFILTTSRHCIIPGLGHIIVYMFMTIPFELFKLFIVYVAHFQYMTKDRKWQVTPRNAI